MVGVTRRRLLSVAALAVSLSWLTVNGRSITSQPPKDDDAEEIIQGADSCVRCHREPSESDRRDKTTDFIMLGESVVFNNNDLHKRAFEALKDPLAKRMGEILRYDVATAPQCLSCHSVDLQPDKKASAKSAKDYYTDFGVSCEECHGFANKWNSPHARQSWRQRDPDYKAKRGQIDLRNPVTRANRCASCHVGNAAEGRFVTHEMYAAGHPPLPSLETMSFSRDQKMHYKLARDLPYLNELAKSDPDKAWKLFHYRGDESESQVARQFAVGAIMALRANAELLARKAEGIDPAKEALDLAHFDCYGCHHDLQSDGWRRARGFIGVPGRPQIRPGVALLAKVVAEHAAAARNADDSSPLTKFGETFKTLTDVFDARPFGEPAKVRTAAEGIVAWCDKALQELEGVRYNKAESAKLLKQIIAAGLKPPEGKTNPWVDADAAQQLIWAVSVLATELGSDDKTSQLKSILGTVKNLRPEVRNTSNNELIAGTLGDRLKRQNNFEPADLYSAFGKMAEVVK